MLSFKTIVAIQMLHALCSSGSRGLSISGLKTVTGINHVEMGQLLLSLRRAGWVTSARNRHHLSTDLSQHTLYELALVTDSKLQLGSRVLVNHWGELARELPNAVGIDNMLEKELTEKLSHITLGELIPAPVAPAKDENVNVAPVKARVLRTSNGRDNFRQTATKRQACLPFGEAGREKSECRNCLGYAEHKQTLLTP